MPILNHAYFGLMSTGASEKAQSLIKHNVVIKINPNNVVGYTTIFTQAIVTQATSYMCWWEEKFIWNLGVTLDLWEEIAYYQL